MSTHDAGRTQAALAEGWRARPAATHHLRMNDAGARLHVIDSPGGWRSRAFDTLLRLASPGHRLQDADLLRLRRRYEALTGSTGTSVAPPGPGDALLVVDMQRDFLPGGSLAVAGSEAILGPVNACIDHFRAHGLPVLASRDWHPPNHGSFKAQGGPWPPHCVAGTPGADFPADLALPRTGLVVSKGCKPEHDAYSAFDGTDLHRQLRALRVNRLFVAGLATDYCVLASVLGARARGYSVVLLRDAVTAVDINPGDGTLALARMAAAGAVAVDSTALPH